MGHIVTSAVALLVPVVQIQTACAHAHLAVGVISITYHPLHIASKRLPRCRGDVIHHATHCLWSKHQRTCSFEYFYALIAIYHWVVIAGVVPIRRIGQWKPIFKQSDLGGTGWIESTHRDIGAQAKTFFITRMYAGYFAQSFVDSEHM